MLHDHPVCESPGFYTMTHVLQRAARRTGARFARTTDPAAHERRASGGVRDAFAGHDAMPASAPSPATVDRADADVPIDSSWRPAGATCGARFRIRASNVDDVAMRSLCP